MDAYAQIRADIDAIYCELDRLGVSSEKIDNATYSIDLNSKAYMDPGEAYDWNKVLFSKRERRIAELLYKRMGRHCDKPAILNAMYHDKDGGEHLADASKIVEVFICKMRKKLEYHKSEFRIETIYGIGYKLVRNAPTTPKPVYNALDALSAAQ